MILEELELFNFCLFKGLHTFDLRPTAGQGTTRPVVLFGGMNGAGKTTILDAIQLALYGSRARSASRVGKAYDEYLRESVHRGIDPREGASVSVRFRYIADGREQQYEVHRDWSVKDKSIRERVRVAKDDSVDQLLSDNWNDCVEDLIPLGVSQLFFFDAEKIRFLADEETDTAALGVAIKSLLGLDLAERLIADAVVVEKRLSESILDQSEDKQVRQLETDLENKSAELAETKAERATLQNPFLRAKDQLDKAKADFAAAGGDHWSRRIEIETQQKEAEQKVDEIEVELRDLAAGELPMLLVSELLFKVVEQDALEEESANAAAFLEMLGVRDKELLEDFKKAKVPAASAQALRKLMDADRRRRKGQAGVQRLLDLSGQSRAAMSRLANGGMDDLRGRTAKLIKQREKYTTVRDNCLRLLAATPKEDVIADLVVRLRESAAACGALEGDTKRLDERIDSLRRERDTLDCTLAEVRRSLVNKQIQHEEAIRMAGLAHKTQTTMRTFLRKATSHKIDRLSDLITESFRFLARKQTLVNRVQIHPETFRIDLLDGAGVLVPKSRLSEGEKQIFAIAVLWGLAKAAPRQLPAIIDTPMARLDSEHRQHLVERYFPNASHQVIVLSTDTEIEREYFEYLRPRIARSFHLRYSEDARCTIPERGYFWDGEKLAARQEVER